MAFTTDEIRANRDYFAHKLHAEKQRNDVLYAVEGGVFNFVLLDTRGRDPFVGGHIPGALLAPVSAREIHDILLNSGHSQQRKGRPPGSQRTRSGAGGF